MPVKKRCQFKTLVLLPASSPPAPSSPAEAESSSTPPAGEPEKASASSVQCPSPAVRIVGTCPHCTLQFCSTHRLPEEHKCSHLQQCRDAAFEANKARLESERTVARKIAST